MAVSHVLRPPNPKVELLFLHDGQFTAPFSPGWSSCTNPGEEKGGSVLAGKRYRWGADVPLHDSPRRFILPLFRWGLKGSDVR